MSKVIFTIEEFLTKFTYDEVNGKLLDNKTKQVSGSKMKSGYYQVSFKNKLFPAHYIVWYIVTGVFPLEKIIHKDGDKTNNLFSNLVEVNSLKDTIDQDFLLDYYNYDEETGLLFHKKNRTLQGTVAGTKSSSGYRHVSLKGKFFQEHHIIWCMINGYFPPTDAEIDHENHIRDDNRIKNLRITSKTGNMQNMSKTKANTSGITGVYYDGRERIKNKWYAQIVVDKKLVSLGNFFTKEEAIQARHDAEIKYNFHKNHGK